MKERGFSSQAELAKKSGVAQRTISNYLSPDLREQGTTGKQPSAKIAEVEKIAQALNMEAWDLLRDLSLPEREMYSKIEAAYKELLAKQPPSAAPVGEAAIEPEKTPQSAPVIAPGPPTEQLIAPKKRRTAPARQAQLLGGAKALGPQKRKQSKRGARNQ